MNGPLIKVRSNESLTEAIYFRMIFQEAAARVRNLAGLSAQASSFETALWLDTGRGASNPL